jgi:hypothetical protein
MLQNYKTCLKFNDYTSEPFDINIDISQGDSLYVTLLFYNTDLLGIPANRNKVMYVDDTMLYMEGNNIDDTKMMLTNMIMRVPMDSESPLQI